MMRGTRVRVWLCLMVDPMMDVLSCVLNLHELSNSPRARVA